MSGVKEIDEDQFKKVCMSCISKIRIYFEYIILKTTYIKG